MVQHSLPADDVDGRQYQPARSGGDPIATVWHAQEWWHRAVVACSSWEELPPSEGVFTRGYLGSSALRPR